MLPFLALYTPMHAPRVLLFARAVCIRQVGHEGGREVIKEEKDTQVETQLQLASAGMKQLASIRALFLRFLKRGVQAEFISLNDWSIALQGYVQRKGGEHNKHG